MTEQKHRMSHGVIGSNRFEALAPDESPGKRPNTLTTPEAFKQKEVDAIHLASIRVLVMVVASKAPIERINSGKKRPPPPPREGQGRKAQGQNDAPVIPVSAWAKPLIPIAAAGVQGKVAFKNKPPAAKAGPLIKAIKVEKAARSLAENEFLKELSLEAPDLVDLIKKQSEAEGRSWFTVEISCAPDQGWTYVGDSLDLDSYVTDFN